MDTFFHILALIYWYIYFLGINGFKSSDGSQHIIKSPFCSNGMVIFKSLTHNRSYGCFIKNYLFPHSLIMITMIQLTNC